MKVGNKIGQHLVCPHKRKGKWIVTSIDRQTTDTAYFTERCSACGKTRSNEVWAGPGFFNL